MSFVADWHIELLTEFASSLNSKPFQSTPPEAPGATAFATPPSSLQETLATPSQTRSTTITSTKPERARLLKQTPARLL